MPAPAASNWRGHAVAFRPNPGPQERFLASSCFEVLYGGAAAGGKSVGGVVGALRHVGKGYGRNYKALCLRREFPEIETTLLPEMERIYPALGGRYRGQKKYWVFPEGERVYLGHAQHTDDIKRYLGTEWQYIFFDELTTFERAQYIYAISRLRSAHGIPVRLRAGTNPGSFGHEWVFERWGAWLDPACALSAAAGQVLYFVRDAEGKEHSVRPGTLDREGNPALGRTFIPANSADNPHITAGYRRVLDELDPVTRAQLKYGDWLIKPGRGLYYKRRWLEPFVDVTPVRATFVRYWDKAATQDGGDWTVGVKLARPHDAEFRGLYFVEDVRRERGSPREIENLMMATAETDGRECTIGIPEDPGAAGKFEADYFIRALGARGFAVRARRETGDKISRQNPVSAQAEARNIRIRRGPWNKDFIAALEAFPDAGADDTDALAGAFAMLTRDVQDYTAPRAAGGPGPIGQNLGGY